MLCGFAPRIAARRESSRGVRPEFRRLLECVGPHGLGPPPSSFARVHRVRPRGFPHLKLTLAASGQCLPSIPLGAAAEYDRSSQPHELCRHCSQTSRRAFTASDMRRLWHGSGVHPSPDHHWGGHATSARRSLRDAETPSAARHRTTTATPRCRSASRLRCIRSARHRVATTGYSPSIDRRRPAAYSRRVNSNRTVVSRAIVNRNAAVDRSRLPPRGSTLAPSAVPAHIPPSAEAYSIPLASTAT